MEPKEVIEKSKALQKATQAGESPAIIVSILNELKEGVLPTEDLLRSTKIGVVVNRSKQHKSPEVARLAAEIVKKWRDDIQKKKGSGSKSNSGTPPASSSEKPSFTVPPDQRDFKKDKVDIAQTNQTVRNSCIGLIYNGLCYLSTAEPSAVLTCAAAVEQAAFKSLGPETNSSYKDKIRTLFANLKNKSNPTLRAHVLSGEITAEKLINMSHDELKSDARRAADEKLASVNMREAMVPQVEKSISTSLECSKCRQRKVSYSQAQTRSADEPMTTFCECTNCGKRWKVSFDPSPLHPSCRPLPLSTPPYPLPPFRASLWTVRYTLQPQITNLARSQNLVVLLNHYISSLASMQKTLLGEKRLTLLTQTSSCSFSFFFPNQLSARTGQISLIWDRVRKKDRKLGGGGRVFSFSSFFSEAPNCIISLSNEWNRGGRALWVKVGAFFHFFFFFFPFLSF